MLATVKFVANVTEPVGQVDSLTKNPVQHPSANKQSSELGVVLPRLWVYLGQSALDR
jgi:hypothetical protein